MHEIYRMYSSSGIVGTRCFPSQNTFCFTTWIKDTASALNIELAPQKMGHFDWPNRGE